MIRFGVVGTGTMGRRYAEGIAGGTLSHRAALAGVCDVDGARARAVGEALGVPAYDSVDALLGAGNLDVVYIAVPDPLHREPFLKAAAAGVAILVEKPMATTIEDAEAMLTAARQAGIVAEVNFSNRWNPPFVQAKAAIDRGELGEILTLNTRLNNAIGSPSKRLSWAGSSTSAWYLLSHALDLARWLTGKQVKQVWANGVKKKLIAMGIPTYDYVHAMVKYADGTDGFFESVWVLPDSMPSGVDFKYQIVGAEGVIHIDTHDQMIHKATATTPFSHVSTLAWAAARFNAFLDRLERNDTSTQALEDGLENTRILVGIHQSLASGELVDLTAL